MIGRHKEFSLFTRTDMYVWHGIRSSTERLLAKIGDGAMKMQIVRIEFK